MNHRMTLLVVAGTLAAGGAAVAGTKSHVDVTLTTPTVVSGQRIPAGDYRIAWAGGPSDVQVTFEKGSKVLAQVNAKLEQLKEPSPEEELISRTLKDGARSLEEVRLRNQKTALVFPVS